MSGFPKIIRTRKKTSATSYFLKKEECEESKTKANGDSCTVWAFHIVNSCPKQGGGGGVGYPYINILADAEVLFIKDYYFVLAGAAK